MIPVFYLYCQFLTERDVGDFGLLSLVSVGDVICDLKQDKYKARG
jgi:hypothetical protein